MHIDANSNYNGVDAVNVTVGKITFYLLYGEYLFLKFY